MTGPNNLNDKIMKEKKNEPHEVWVLCEQWNTPEGFKFEICSSDIMVFASLEEAVEEWKRRRDDRMNREGCKVIACDEENEFHPFVEARNYEFIYEHDEPFNVRTLFLNKTYFK